ncbi:ly6/PLAUR domain-containing protein 4 [Suncus etruscus]|uniref:ly6/PLAUR domain-containing protein 4 n=1 Tax=Suncus etruscus TaxID=109475 RepID=UPI0021106DCA|nr:ly6/PLAUR domain-containing protein 4 [Suncus etruscus]
MGPQYSHPVQLLCLLGLISTVPCMSCGSESLGFPEGTKRGVVGFKGCSQVPSYPQKTSYIVAHPGISIVYYSRVCRMYLCNSLTNMDPFLNLKAHISRTITFSSEVCPTCVGRHSWECIPDYVSSESCPNDATKCYSSTLKFQAGSLNSTFLLMGCTYTQSKLLTHFQTIGTIEVSEVINILKRSQVVDTAPSSRGPARGNVGNLIGLLFIFRILGHIMDQEKDTVPFSSIRWHRFNLDLGSSSPFFPSVLPPFLPACTFYSTQCQAIIVSPLEPCPSGDPSQSLFFIPHLQEPFTCEQELPPGNGLSVVRD